MDKYIGFDVDDKKTMACMVQSGCPDRYATLPTEVEAMRQWLGQQWGPGDRLHLTFEVLGRAGYLYDELIDQVDTLVVSNPSQMTWIYRTAKKTDRVDARKQVRENRTCHRMPSHVAVLVTSTNRSVGR